MMRILFIVSCIATPTLVLGLPQLYSEEVLDLNSDYNVGHKFVDDNNLIVVESISFLNLERICTKVGDLVFYIKQDDLSIDCRTYFNNDKKQNKENGLHAVEKREIVDELNEGSGDDLFSTEKSVEITVDEELKTPLENKPEITSFKENQLMGAIDAIESKEPKITTEKSVETTQVEVEENVTQVTLEEETFNKEIKVPEVSNNTDKIVKVLGNDQTVLEGNVKEGEPTLTEIKPVKISKLLNALDDIENKDQKIDETLSQINHTVNNIKEKSDDQWRNKETVQKDQKSQVRPPTSNVDEPKSGEATTREGGGKDTKILIFLFVGVMAVGIAAFGYNFIKKRRSPAATVPTHEMAENGNVRRQAVQNSKPPVEEEMKEMKPLMENGTNEAANTTHN